MHSAATAGVMRLYSAVAYAIRDRRDVPIAVIIWSHVETTTTLVCVGVPVCLPLWKLWWQKMKMFFGRDAAPGFRPHCGQGAGERKQQAGSVEQGAICLYTIGGTPLNPTGDDPKPKARNISVSLFSMASSMAKMESRVREDPGSDEENLRDWQGQERRLPS